MTLNPHEFVEREAHNERFWQSVERRKRFEVPTEKEEALKVRKEIMKQGTQEWRDARLGHVTASRFADVISDARSKTGLSKTAETYLLELIGERLTGKAEDFENYAMKWGREQEPIAREAYTWRTGNLVVEDGFTLHDTEELVGCSCDGLIGDLGLVEIKCPLTPKEHVRVLVSGEIPSDHVPQVQGQLWITGRNWCDFVSFHPSMKESAHQLVVIRVERDQQYIDELAEKVVRFRDRLVETLSKITQEVICRSA